MRRWTPFILGIIASIAATALLWSLGIAGFGLFLFLPFLFFPWRRDAPATSHAQACPQCGRPQMPGDNFCPRDGHRF